MDERMDNSQILVDTSILIEYLRKTNKPRTIMYRYAGQAKLTVSVITEFEFWIGATPKNRGFINGILSTMDVLPFDSACVQTALTIYQQLKTINKRLPIQDTFIAATALHFNLPLLTLNSKHFAHITDLVLLPTEI